MNSYLQIAIVGMTWACIIIGASMVVAHRTRPVKLHFSTALLFTLSALHLVSGFWAIVAWIIVATSVLQIAFPIAQGESE